jgi:NADPH:quinone reductase-like Zn-dependent oxidoreductase
MKAVQITAFGNPAEVAHCVEMPELERPTEDQVTIRLEAAPINPSDLFMMTGRYGYRPSLPSILGAEGVGVVSALGAKVKHLKEGDRVLIPYGTPAWSERVNANADWLAPLPKGDVDQLSMLGVNPATAYLLLDEIVKLQPGEWVVQNGANSAVGRAIIVIARQMGLRTVNVVRRAEAKSELASLGDKLVLIDGPDLAKRVAKETGGAKIRLGIDVVGDSSTLNLTNCLVDGAVVVTYGAVSGKHMITAAPFFIFRHMTMRGFWLFHWFPKASSDRIRKMYEFLAPLVVDGRLHIPVAGAYGLEDADRAILAAAKGAGKVLFKV